MGEEEKDRNATRGIGVVFRARTALKHARDAGGRRKSDWNSRDAMVCVDEMEATKWIIHGGRCIEVRSELWCQCGPSANTYIIHSMHIDNYKTSHRLSSNNRIE